MKFIDVKLVTQLEDTAQEVSRRKYKNALGHMFSVKAALIKSTLLEWFNKKIKSQQLDFLKKMMKKIQLIGKKINASYVKCH